MGHNIEATDRVFSVREPMWHQLGEVLTDYPTREEAQRLVHDWEPVTEPVYTRQPVVTASGALEWTYEEVIEKKALVRSDNRNVLSVQNDTYEPVHNSTLWDIAEAVQQSGADVMYETAGSLKGGRKVWIMLRLEQPVVVKGDPQGATIPYFVLQNAHDGSASCRGQGVQTRIVCDNTAQMADLEALENGTAFNFHHTKNVEDRIAEARQALAGWRENIATWQRYHEMLVDRPVTTTQRANFVEKFIPMPPGHTVSQIVVDNVQRDRDVLRSIFTTPTMEGISNTAYGLVQAATEYQTHYRRARSVESRFQRTYLDRSVVVRDAYGLAMAV